MCEILNRIVDFQISLLSLLRPGQWLGYFHKLNYAEAIWTFKGLTEDHILKTLTEINPKMGYIEAQGCVAKSNTCCASCNGIPCYKAHYTTAGLKWADVIELSFLRDVPKQEVHARINSTSLSVWPAAFPLSPLFGIVLAWLPFFDHGANRNHIQEIKASLQKELGQDIEQKWVERGAKVIVPGGSWLALTITIIAFVVTVVVTVLNLTVIPPGHLNNFITFVTVSLTILTFCTWINAWQAYKDEFKKPKTESQGLKDNNNNTQNTET